MAIPGANGIYERSDGGARSHGLSSDPQKLDLDDQLAEEELAA